MKGEFIPYELALRLGSLGFDEPCVAHWFNNVGIGIEFRLEPLNKAIAKTNISVYYELAPLYQQAFRWFREKGYLSYIEVFSDGKYDYINVSSHFSEEFDYNDGPFDTYEEAELACLEKLIEIVENNK